MHTMMEIRRFGTKKGQMHGYSMGVAGGIAVGLVGRL
jgi:hypothetical protein